MSYSRERDEFIAATAMAGIKRDDARHFLRLAATHGRLAVAQCNGDWPADNGEREVKFCPECEAGFVPSSYRKGVCPDCRIEQRIKLFAQAVGVAVVFQGDPRGYTVKLSLGGSEVGIPQRN